ncbi:hypothetical protein MPSEU_000461000 [Mayamaea pseudoterrestris]|nr:hypothetical protein MPSEU_000461000 [Mayamaea pseudoterrestris]
MDKNTFVKKLFLSLPPMDQHDLEVSLDRLETLHPHVNKDVLLAAHDVRACVNTSNDNDAAKSSQLMSLLRRLQEKRDKFYASKQNVEHRLIGSETSKDGTKSMHLQTYLCQLDAPNARSGSWVASWQILVVSERECQLSGSVEIHSRYAEQTNVHMQATRTFPEQSLNTEQQTVNSKVADEQISHEKQLAVTIVDAIWDMEEELFADLQRMFDKVDDSLKRIRRILPITKTKFKWDSATSKHVKLLNESGSLHK